MVSATNVKYGALLLFCQKFVVQLVSCSSLRKKTRKDCSRVCTGLLFRVATYDPFFLGNALIRRLVRIGVLDEGRMRLDYVLALKIEDFLERRLQTQVFKSGLAKSIHHARVLIRQRHIR